MSIKAFFDTPYQDILSLCDGKKFRYTQIIEWICKKHVHDFRLMTNLPASLRDKLHDNYCILPLTVNDTIVSADTTTQKILFLTHEGFPVETVSMRYEDRHTLCVSVQSGCRMACSFCATASLGFKRSLTPAEIFAQVLYFPDITNVVFMGMGEPFDVTDSLLTTLDLMNAPDYLDFGARRITISTAGLPDGILALAEKGKQFGISWSLHATDEHVRKTLMPGAARYSIEEVIEALLVYRKKTNADITIEYILIPNVNMKPLHASGLMRIARRLRAKINCIPYNSHPNAPFRSPTHAEIQKFTALLDEGGVTYFIRDSKGADIQAGCGQLAGRRKERDT